jgi:hypothetical protein
MKKIFSETNCNFPSMKTKFCIVLLLGTVLNAPIVVLNVHAQGPPSGSQLTSLADRWTKWILSIDTATETNPSTHTYTGDCSQLIQGNTMFLVGQTGTTGGTVDHGTCNVPSGTSIFFPVINFVEADCTPNPSKPPTLCTSTGIQTPAHGDPFAYQRKIANDFINGVDVGSLKSTLDRKAIDIARVQSPPGGFGVRVTAHNVLFGDLTQPPPAGISLPEGTYSLHAVVDGYWSLLSPPLSTGEHTLTFGGCASGSGCQTNSYTLVVRGNSGGSNSNDGSDSGSSDEGN